MKDRQVRSGAIDPGLMRRLEKGVIKAPRSFEQFTKILHKSLKGKIPNYLLTAILEEGHNEALWGAWEIINDMEGELSRELKDSLSLFRGNPSRENQDDAYDHLQHANESFLGRNVDHIIDGLVELVDWHSNSWNFAPGGGAAKEDLKLPSESSLYNHLSKSAAPCSARVARAFRLEASFPGKHPRAASRKTATSWAGLWRGDNSTTSRKTAGRPPRNAGEARELFEWGRWPGKPGSFEWDMVEQEGPKDLRFDWRRGSVWLRFYGGAPEAEGKIPPHFKKHLTKLGFDVY